MRAILSRKGFDSSAGGIPSPIFPDGSMVSLPIPSRDPVTYSQIRWKDTNLGEIAAALTGRPLFRRIPAHLDPDLAINARPRLPGWRPAFGQTGAAQTHLANQGVGIGDLFLFFGWFREVEEDGAGGWRCRRGAPDIHALFGWLQVGELLRLGPDSTALRASRPEFAEHPHFNGRWDTSNTVYIASERLVIEGQDMGVPGGGTFPHFHPRLQLTKPGENRGTWSLPSWFLPADGPALSYHADPARWARDGERCTLRTVGRGQEFVLDVTSTREAVDWFPTLIQAERQAPPSGMTESPPLPAISADNGLY
ncbi:Nmad3 family putative nucleotide modification protein [Azospirillum argentinense]